MNYDKEADVLYIQLKKPSHADDSEITEGDILIRYEKGEIVGITVLNASKRKRIKPVHKRAERQRKTISRSQSP
jgi:uncharacterized protein YuzE